MLREITFERQIFFGTIVWGGRRAASLDCLVASIYCMCIIQRPSLRYSRSNYLHSCHWLAWFEMNIKIRAYAVRKPWCPICSTKPKDGGFMWATYSICLSVCGSTAGVCSPSVQLNPVCISEIIPHDQFLVSSTPLLLCLFLSICV